MSLHIRIILTFAAIIGLLFLIAAYRGHARPQQPAAEIRPAVVRCAPIQTRPYRVTEQFYGKLQANVRLNMAFQIAGRISKLGPGQQKLKESDVVHRGQVIAELEPLRYEAMLRAAEAQVQESKAKMDETKARVDDANAKVADAERDLEIVRDKFALRVVNKSNVRKAELEVKLAKAGRDFANAVHRRSDATYSAVRSQAEVARVNLEDATLRAPQDAIVASMPVEIGQMVHSGEAVMTLVDVSKIKLVIGVVERKLPLLEVGQKVEIEVLALRSQSNVLGRSMGSSQYDGVVTIVPPAADPNDGLFKVQIELTRQDDLLHPGMVAKATVMIMEKQAAAIPAEAATRVGNKAYAFFVADRFPVGLNLGPLGSATINVPTTRARRVELEPDLFDRDYYLVSDLPEGCDRLIIEGADHLSDGDLVRVVKPIERSAEASVAETDKSQ